MNIYDTVMDFDIEFYDENARFGSNSQDNFSFFTTNNQPSSPRQCPISPSHDSSELLPMMDEDFVDFTSFIDKENKKPYSPARKRLNMDALATSSSPVTKNILQHSSNVNISSPFRSSGLKRTQSSLFESPVQNKKLKSENDHIYLQNQHIRKPISIMNVLTSSSENLRKNRL
ncbi:unnamed protein product [Chironomus riparius]|uniref:Uncharacterized protein n=1 Tax=Chironomus riparius TaxID=315576 RepID=A0A9N9RZS4_9DIPT|nr:unnamed protein product [Chironomus riparius]